MTEQRFINTPGAISQLPDVIAAFNAERCLILFTNSVSKFSSIEGAIRALPGTVKHQQIVVRDRIPNLEALLVRYKELRSFMPQLIVAIGGGTVLDTGKLLSAFLPLESIDRESVLATTSLTTDPIPIIAIPTTAGSGSDATPFAVYYDRETKYSLEDLRLVPQVVIADAELTATLSPRQTAISGIDAICQAIESIWAARSNEESRRYAVSALDLLLPNLAPAVRAPTPELRSKLLLGANLAGRAIAITRTTAAHAYSYCLTAAYGVAHGHAVGICMLALLPLTLPRVEKERLQLITAAFSTDEPATIEHSFRNLLEDVGLEPTLAALNLNSPEILKRILREVDPNRLANHPQGIDSNALLARLRLE